MPVEWVLHVLEARLEREFGAGCEVHSVDLHGLTPDESTAALDALVAEQGSFPIVLVNGVAACVGAVDVDAVVAAAGGA